MTGKNANQEQGLASNESQKQFRTAVIVYAVIEFLVIAVFIYKRLR